MKFNFKIISSLLGLLLMINGAFMFICIPFSLFYGEETWEPILISGGITILGGVFLRFIAGKKFKPEITKRDGYIIVTFGWLFMSLFGALPFYLSGEIPLYGDAFFETISGFTTTGATILVDIESLPKGLLFWRSLTHWMGGMGIIVLTIAILPLLGIGGMQLFVAESPGISPDKLHPRIMGTARRLWLIYVSLTFAEMILLLGGGMTFFDSINHSMATMATGGFSTKNSSIAHFDSAYIQYVIMFFMLLAGTNFTLIYFGFKGKLSRLWKNEEFRSYLSTIIIIGLIVTLVLFVARQMPFEEAFRTSFFQVISVVTTTGFITADYTAWLPFVSVIFFILFFTGGSTGSTAGGIKIMRHVILIKNSFLELKRQIHPSAIIPVRFNNRSVPQSITYNIMAFVLIYLMVFFSGSAVMAFLGLDFVTAIGSVTATLGNIGPGLGGVGPVENFSGIPMPGKWFLSLLMLIGRLELFTVLILLTPHFWLKN